MSNGAFIKNRVRRVKNVRIKTAETDIASKYNTISVEVGTTGYCGGNEKSGSRTYIRICDVSNSDIDIERDGTGKGFVLRASGDCELYTLIEALDFCSAELKKQCKIKENTRGKAHNDDIFTSASIATDKQIDYLVSLVKDSDFELITTKITQKDASALIKFFKGERKSFPECAADIIKRKNIF